MKQIIHLLLIGLALLLCVTANGLAQTAPAPLDPGTAPSLDDIMDRVENRYSGPGFSVHFFQISTLKAMNVSDYAGGKMLVKRPGKMRWDYETPTPQLIIADNKDLWIYRPEDNQVSHGAAPQFFSGGNGAGFLADMASIRKDFNVSLESSDQSDSFRIKLIPKTSSYEVTAIYLTVSAVTFEINVLSTLNAYGDETRFELSGYRFDPVLDSELFQFKIPEGAEVLTLDNN
ncbi:MAG: outer membrane lipoprotein carrier protein LolA [Desulfobacterales bacterium]|jgi:outer membrane lipoprotein carrier protein|nr:outer membrane lipoprotein carrier protein LolA [Desulfobacterales bacterium]